VVDNICIFTISNNLHCIPAAIFTSSCIYGKITTNSNNFYKKEVTTLGKRLGNYIKNLRKEKKIPARVLSEQTGISKSFIDYVENGLREPSAESLAKIAAILDVSLDTLIKIQVDEQLDKAATAFEVSNSDLENVNVNLRAAGRDRDNQTTVSEEALKKVKLALQGGSNKQAVLDTIQNVDLRAIFRASENLSDDDIQKIRKVIESLYPDAFKN